MGPHWGSGFLVLVVVLAFCTLHTESVELTPPYFNLAEGRKISASATCGEDIDGPELYCKLVGANTENENHFHSLIQGQVCDYCDASRPDGRHPPEYAIDGKETWWQSPPLSRGMKYNEVNLTIDFGQIFHVAYIYIRMGNSPRPGLWTLEKSADYGKTWTSWMHFSDTLSDCETYFGKDSLRPITKDNDVICTTDYSKIVPLENGEIPIRLLHHRPSANDYFNSTVLQEWTKATNVRFRFIRTKNLYGHLMSVARQDPTVTRRYFYSIKDISIGGRCMCNGHADLCNVLDPKNPIRVLACQCQHNTCGIHCNECCKGFEQKKWQLNSKTAPFQCEPCNCFGHSNDCKYDEEVDRHGLSIDINGNYAGGGVCQNCQHNTMGINCNKCKDTFYRPRGRYWNETDVCQPCNCHGHFHTGNCDEETGRCHCKKEYQEPYCDSCSYGHYDYPNCKACPCFLNGTNGYQCEALSGRCPCKENFAGDFCNQCAPGYYDFPECNPCECNEEGSANDNCDVATGQCVCKANFHGLHCDECKNGYYEYPNCLYCDCDFQGTVEGVCDKEIGKCICKEGYGGPRCDQCLPGYYNYPNCIPCECSTIGSVSNVCDTNGRCPCLTSFGGKQCNQCSAGFYNYPECLPCNCAPVGSKGISCNNEGQCTCAHNFDGLNCNQCKEGFYNYPDCEECNCDPAGVIARFGGCGSMPVGELCQCKERVIGRICNQCKPLYWNLSATNPQGCEECNCNLEGTIGSLDTCESKTGQCTCKPNVQGRICDSCTDGTFDLYSGSLFGCKDCDCDIGGAIDGACNKFNGQCKCHPRVNGRKCDRPLSTHFYPTLYQYQYEYEDGFTRSGSLVRYQYDEEIFPGFSKRGYAKISVIQTELINEVNIFKSSVYRLIIRYLNPSDENIVANILITSDNPNEVDQNAKVLFKPSSGPQFVTVSGDKGEIPSPIVLDPGRYSIAIKTDQHLYLDYFVLLPAAYYEAGILTRKIENPCEVGEMGLCRHYAYPRVDAFAPSFTGFRVKNNEPKKIKHYFNDTIHLSVVGEKSLPHLTEAQQTLQYPLQVNRPGPYIIVVDYISDRNNSESYLINVNLNESREEPDGRVTIYPCYYTMVCRQPVIDGEYREKIFHIDDAEANNIIIIKGDEQSSVGIKSVTAVPLDKWSTDFIKPKPVCIMDGGKCVSTPFLPAPDSKKIEFEIDHEDRLATVWPPGIHENNTKLIFINEKDSTIEISSKVPEPGRYVVILKYYQPYHPQFNIIYLIETDKQKYNGKLNIKNCASLSGCRDVLEPDNGYPYFDLDENFKLTLTNPETNGLWLDYILLMPFDRLTPSVLQEEQFDQTKEFIQQCGQDHFHIQLNATKFCRDSVFSLTADYNQGTLPCNCDYQGSTTFECDPFGGQCQCKANIIGRQCEACKTGYYGFPDCKPCDCPSTAQCQKDTGECICPPHVTGAKCDQCEPYTFGYDQIIGCEECNCDPQGVINGNLQCDAINGSCACQPSVEGRSCDKCVNGHYGFPYCYPCRCNHFGTTNEICDKVDETCFCKKNVNGQACDTCIDGTYNLEPENPDGCTKCFCFGKTTRCRSAYMRAFNVSMMKDVSLNVITFDDGIEILTWNTKRNEILINETTIEADFSMKQIDNEMVYFGVLDYLLNQNNHLSAYGGYLTYKLYYTTGPFGKSLLGPDVILEGKNLKVSHISYEQPANAHLFRGSVRIIESNFRTIPEDKPVTREQFMTLLRDLNMIYIRASYWENEVVAHLSDVMLTMADEDRENYNLYTELPVESCMCPPGYKGHSCEDCADGYYRDPNGPHGGYCLPCQCNGHSEKCDCQSGKCYDCQHGTTGDHCEMCIEGYYGNATIGTPTDCMICACPLPIDSNNFATTCEVSVGGDQIHCECKEGYIGARCQSCAPGFYGRPEERDDYCKPCQCSGNINPYDEHSCDSVTGECLNCMNNTYGTACNLCAPGYYGDAIELKNCQSCVCDLLGTDHCDPHTGQCNCQRNVIGEKCDRCKIDHYGFVSGIGCNACDCGVASESTQCDDSTGECRCKPGVGGRQCDRCLPGYWNYTPEGCSPCSCNTDYSRGLGCNVHTGQCECLPGVVGEKCDSCPHRWVLIPETGCHECDKCHHGLLDDTDALREQLDPVLEEFESAAGGYFTSQRLTYFGKQVEVLKPLVTALDPQGVNLSPIRNDLEELEAQLADTDRRNTYAEQRAKDLALTSKKLLLDSNGVLDNSRTVKNTAQMTVQDVENLANSFETNEDPRAEGAIIEAEDTLNRLKNFELPHVNVDEQLGKVEVLTAEISEFIEPVADQNVTLESLKHDIGKFDDKLEDLHNWSNDVEFKCMQAEGLHRNNKQAADNSKLDALNNQMKEAEDNIVNTHKAIKDIETTLGDIYTKGLTLKDTKDKLDDVNNEVDILLPQNTNKYSELEGDISDAIKHTGMLRKQADDIQTQYNLTTANSEIPIKAARAYSDIVSSVYAAQNTAKAAKLAAGNATDLSNGLLDRANDAILLAGQLLNDCRGFLSKTQLETGPQLNRTADDLQAITNVNKISDDKLNAINKELERIPMESQSANWDEAKEAADEARTSAKNALNTMKPFVKKLPNALKNAKQMQKKVEDANQDIQQAKTQVERVSTLIPNLQEMVDDIGQRQDNTMRRASDLAEKMENLRRQIASARDIANSIKVGVTFHPNTTLELKTPENLPLQSANSRVSTYFKTSKPNGLLMYLGNDNSVDPNKRGKKNDYMALEIENGYPVLSMDLGNGPERIISDKYAADNNWYQVIAERNGPKVKLTVREQLDNNEEMLHETEHKLSDENPIFNVDKDSKLFVGGYSPEFQPPDSVKSSSFEGQIEDVRVGDDNVGLWNFVDGQDNNHGAQERDRLTAAEAPVTGYKFSGHGFVVLDAKPYVFKQRSSIQFKFKCSPDVKDGLLFYAGEQQSFISIELRDGEIFFQYKLGKYVASLRNSDFLVNDDNWHKVEAERDGRKGILKIDNMVVYSDETMDTEENLKITDQMYFGGYPFPMNHSEVNNVNFEGCIDHVFISGTPVDLSRNLRAAGVQSGCPSKMSTTLSYAPRQVGHLKIPGVNYDGLFKINLKFKTRQPQGVLFFTTNFDQSATASLTLENGALVFRCNKVEVNTLTDPNRFNNGEWHDITAIHDSKKLRLTVDEYSAHESNLDAPQLHIPLGDIYFGGLPNGFKPARGSVSSPAYFTGCIKDVTLNDQIINFANSTDHKSALLDKCGSELFDYDLATVPILFSDPDYAPDPVQQPDIDEPVTVIPNQGKKQEESITEAAVATTTVKPTKATRRPRPSKKRPSAYHNISEPACKLPIEPDINADYSTDGYRFGVLSSSRLEFTTYANKLNKSYEFSLQFKTDRGDGILFYAASPRHSDFISLIMREGKVYHIIRCGNGKANISSITEYRDDQWHTVVFSRQNNLAKLKIDDDPEIEDVAACSRQMSIVTPLYVGGVSPPISEDVKLNVEVPKEMLFQGCIKNFKISDRPIGEPTNQPGVVPCSTEVEKGVFYGKGGGYVKLREHFKVGVELKVQMDIKPRTLNGVLMTVHGKSGHFVLQLINGTINLSVDSGDGPLITTYKLASDENICDGEWRTISVVKSQFVTTIAVDGVYGTPSVKKSLMNLNTNRPLFLGGHPLLSKIRGLQVRLPYQGCIRNVIVRDEPIDIHPSMTVGAVHAGVCSTN